MGIQLSAIYREHQDDVIVSYIAVLDILKILSTVKEVIVCS